jgi:hypothetical protein
MFVAVSEMLSQWMRRDRISDMAERVAGRSRLVVWQRVMHRLPSMGPTEGRGYVRARAIAIVREETSRLIEQEGAGLIVHRSKIEEAAMQLVIEAISTQLRQPKAVSRRAA